MGEYGKLMEQQVSNSKQTLNSYGYFNNESREYVITNPKTPVPWINYVGTLAFGGLIDQTGGSLICCGDPATNRITKYIPQLPAADFKGETAYIRLRQKDGYKIFSPYFTPTLDTWDLYECRVGLLYTRIISEFHGIRTEVTIFVPSGSRQLLRDYRITNLRDEAVEIDFIPVVEYTHPLALLQLTNADWVPQTMQSKQLHEEEQMRVIAQYPFMCKESKINYFTSNRPVSSFETARPFFLGDNGYGTWQNPQRLQEEELSCYEALRGDNICALMHHLGSIPAGGEVRVITQLGQDSTIEQALPSIRKYRDESAVDQAFAELNGFWEGFLAGYQVSTPNESMNHMLNIHNPRQCYITKNWSRYLSLYQLGLGDDRGIGFRDSSQDVMGVLGLIPEEGREFLEKLLSVQKQNGSAMHQFNPVSMIANEGDSRHAKNKPKYYGDDHLWAVLAVCAYLKETGNLEFLNKEIPFYEKDEDGKVIEQGSVLEHLKRAVAFSHDQVGAHGLPLLGFADWNDTVNLPAGAESVFIACQYGVALNELIELFKHLGDEKSVALYQAWHQEMKERVNQHAWDGEWYTRYFDEKGAPLGSKDNREGKIYTNAQSWSVLAGFAEDGREKQALESVYTKLNTKNGIKLSWPGYSRFDSATGGVSTYPPGAKENGGIFLHTNPWVMIAETLVGNGERAFQYYDQINPASRNERIEEFECEPYSYPQNILGDEHPQFGLGRNSWLSGTSSWVYQAATKFILGVRPSYEGLIVDPCIPAQWDGFTVTRIFRGCTYHIQVQNPRHISKGSIQLTIDGKACEGNVIPFSQNSECQILAEMK